MQKILFISNVTNGLYLFRRELIEALVKDYRVEVLANDTGSVKELKELGCHITFTPMENHGTNPVQEFRLFQYYKKQIKKAKPDVVLTYTIKPNVYAGIVCKKLHIPYLANVTGLGTAVENQSLLQKITLFLLKQGLKGARKVFFQNSENRDFLLKHRIITCPYELIPGSGVNLARFPLLDYPNGETVDFVFISRVMKEKGIEQFLDAAKCIREKYPITRFHVCGVGASYKEKLEKLTTEGIIIYHGKISDVVSMHRISACTIHPTYYPEGMSNVLLESCACGRPIITTDRPGCREIVVDGVNGFIVKEQDSHDLIDKIEKFLMLDFEKRRQMGLAGREKVEQEFDRSIVVNKYLEEIKHVGL